MESLVETLQQLENDLAARPIRIAAHSDMPFAIFRYAPQDEFALRKHLRLLAISLQKNHKRRVTFISIARLVWDTVRQYGGSEYLFQTETFRGFHAAQVHVNNLLTSLDFRPAADAVLEKMARLKPEKDLVSTRAADWITSPVQGLLYIRIQRLIRHGDDHLKWNPGINHSGCTVFLVNQLSMASLSNRRLPPSFA